MRVGREALGTRASSRQGKDQAWEGGYKERWHWALALAAVVVKWVFDVAIVGTSLDGLVRGQRRTHRGLRQTAQQSRRGDKSICRPGGCGGTSPLALWHCARVGICPESC